MRFVALALLAAAFEPQAPRNPPEPFPVAVVAVVAGDAADEDALIRILSAVEAVRERVGDRDRWFRIVEEPEAARIVLRVAGYRVAEKMQPKVNRHILNGTPIMVEGSVVVETHSVNAIAIIERDVKPLIGLDEREQGASLRNAAGDLAEELERHCKANYVLLASP